MHTGGLEVQIHSFSTLVLVGCEWSTTCSTSRKEPQYPLKSTLGEPQSWSENRKYSFLCLDSNLTIQPIALSISITLSRLPTYYYFNSANLWVCHFFNSCMCYWKWKIWCTIVLDFHWEGICVKSQPDYILFLVFPHQFCDTTYNRP
jgi:hypothetical protein